MKYQKREPSGFLGNQTHDPMAKYFSAYDKSNKKAF